MTEEHPLLTAYKNLSYELQCLVPFDLSDPIEKRDPVVVKRALHSKMPNMEERLQIEAFLRVLEEDNRRLTTPPAAVAKSLRSAAVELRNPLPTHSDILPQTVELPRSGSRSLRTMYEALDNALSRAEQTIGKHFEELVGLPGTAARKVRDAAKGVGTRVGRRIKELLPRKPLGIVANDGIVGSTSVAPQVQPTSSAATHAAPPPTTPVEPPVAALPTETPQPSVTANATATPSAKTSQIIKGKPLAAAALPATAEPPRPANAPPTQSLEKSAGRIESNIEEAIERGINNASKKPAKGKTGLIIGGIIAAAVAVGAFVSMNKKSEKKRPPAQDALLQQMLPPQGQAIV